MPMYDTCVHVCTCSGVWFLTRACVLCGAAVEYQTTGATALFVACQYGRVAVLPALLDHGASLTQFQVPKCVHRSSLSSGPLSLHHAHPHPCTDARTLTHSHPSPPACTHAPRTTYTPRPPTPQLLRQLPSPPSSQLLPLSSQRGGMAWGLVAAVPCDAGTRPLAPACSL